jgi:hypothetical protein
MDLKKNILPRIHAYLGDRRIRFVVFFVLLLIAAFALKDPAYHEYLSSVRSHDNQLKVGFVTDIHAGNKKSKEKGSGLIYPMHFRQNMISALDDMKYDDYVISLGDNLDVERGCQKYIAELKGMTKDFNFLWTKGNHDKDACFPSLSPNGYYYYYLDVNDWRLIILDNTGWYTKDQKLAADSPNSIGVIESAEMDWIRNALKTDRKVLIGIHVPLWDDNGNGNFSVRPDYVDFKKMLEDSGNVKYVLSGHYHNDDWEHEENGITYYILPSIEQDGFEGYHMTLTLE